MNKYLVVTNAGQQFYVPREYFSLEAPAASSHFNGVRSSKTSGKWEARIQHEGKTHQIGTFDDEIEAAKAWDAKARSLRGAATPTNFDLARWQQQCTGGTCTGTGTGSSSSTSERAAGASTRGG